MLLDNVFNENLTNIVKLTLFHFLLFVVSLDEYSLTHSRYYRRLPITSTLYYEFNLIVQLIGCISL